MNLYLVLVRTGGAPPTSHFFDTDAEAEAFWDTMKADPTVLSVNMYVLKGSWTRVP